MLRKFRPSHGTVVAYLALFVALGGTTYAASQLPKDSVGTPQLKRHAVTRAKIQPHAVGSGVLADRAVGNANLKNGAVGSSNLKNGAVSGGKLAPSAVGSAALAVGAVGSANLKNGAVSAPKLAPALLDAIQSPSVRFGGTREFHPSVTQPGSCSSSETTTADAVQFDRLVFLSYAANRTAASGTTQYTVLRPGGNITFSLTGPGSKSDEAFFAVPAGATYPAGAQVSDDACTGSGGTLTANYRVIELHEAGGP
jgi:hypothetical protein